MRHLLAAAAVCALLSGCAGLSVPDEQSPGEWDPIRLDDGVADTIGLGCYVLTGMFGGPAMSWICAGTERLKDN